DCRCRTRPPTAQCSSDFAQRRVVAQNEISGLKSALTATADFPALTGSVPRYPRGLGNGGRLKAQRRGKEKKASLSPISAAFILPPLPRLPAGKNFLQKAQKVFPSGALSKIGRAS